MVLKKIIVRRCFKLWQKKNIVVVGAHWGDEGKAKIVDFLAEKRDCVVRFQGGANAGHTVYVNNEKFVFHLIPSGIIHPDKICIIGNGVVVDFEAVQKEIDDLKNKGVEIEGRFFY